MVVTVRDAAKLLSVSPKTIRGWVRDGELPYHLAGDQCYFERFELFQFAIDRHLKPVALLDGEGGVGDHWSLHESLAHGGIWYDVEGTTKQEVLHNALNRINGLDRTAIEPFLEMFMIREELSSTGIGDGIAIPHARGPVIGYVDAPILSLSFLKHPVEYGASDGIPVHVLFLIISPTVRSHLQILGKLAFALQSAACREAIRNHASRDVILDLFRQCESTPEPESPR